MPCNERPPSSPSDVAEACAFTGFCQFRGVLTIGSIARAPPTGSDTEVYWLELVQPAKVTTALARMKRRFMFLRFELPDIPEFVANYSAVRRRMMNQQMIPLRITVTSGAMPIRNSLPIHGR